MSVSGKLIEYYGSRYRDYHQAHPKSMPGKVPPFKVQRIAQLVAEFQAASGSVYPRLLDYGSGKGYQYLVDRIHESWGGYLPTCYDPGVIQLNNRPRDQFDGIICTDVLEHIEEQHVPDFISDIFGLARQQYHRKSIKSFVYIHICCRPAHKHFADGTNFHATLHQPSWWKTVLNARKPHHTKLVTTFEVPHAEGGGDLPPDK